MSMPEQRPRSTPAALLVPLVAALIGTAIYHRYSLLTGLDRVQADSGDSRFVAFLLEHWRNALGGQINWRSPPIFWPLPDTLAYSDLLVGMGVVHGLLRTVLDVFPAMNLQLILLSLGTFGTAYLFFARGLRLSVWGATSGAYFFAFSWPRYVQLVHVQLQFTVLLPLLALLALECCRDGRDLRRTAFFWRAAGFVALLVALVATALYYAIFFALGLTVALCLCLLHRPARVHLWAVLRRQILPLGLSALLGLGLLAPIIQLYLPVLRVSSGRSWAEVAAFLPTPTHLLWMGRESLVWGWLFGRWPEATIIERWPELRIGVGMIVSLAWAAAVIWSAWRLVARRRTLDRTTAILALVIVTGFILQLLMMRVPYRSAWWFVWKFFPGASGIRAVPRLEIMITLSIGAAIGLLVDRARSTGAAVRTVVSALAVLAAIEQIGSIAGYSGRAAEALSRSVGDAIPASCTAAYFIAPPDMQSGQVVDDEAHFDAKTYLLANPDVAANWHGSPWDHYQRFGRDEHRALDPAAAGLHLALMYFAYNYTIPLAADLRGIPVVNGLSGWTPPGWDLFDVLSPAAPEHLADWLKRNGRPASDVCVVPIRITLPMVPDLPPGMMP
ncbi:MAG: hypothetical protein ACRYG8_49185 [Janthinobacterium lividum]